MKRTTLLLAAALAVLATSLPADDYRLGSLEIRHPYAAASLRMAKSGAGYLEIANTGTEADRLLSVSADFANAMVHTTEFTDGVARMIHLENGIEIPAGGTVALAPGGMHLMFMRLQQPMVAGETRTVMLTFEKAGTIDIELKVEERSGEGTMQHGTMQHGAPTN